MSNFRLKLQDLDSGEFLDVVADVVREQTLEVYEQRPGHDDG